jgi:hypothetical protein
MKVISVFFTRAIIKIPAGNCDDPKDTHPRLGMS